jgi:Transglutaminase-like superfamily
MDFAMRFLVLRAYLQLIFFDLYLTRRNFAALHERVRSYPTAKESVGPNGIERICAAMDVACIWYWKEALCLQRSAATACLLKRCGIPAQMVIGAQQMPFKAHAWVEVDGRVVNDKPYMTEIYAVLDRF